MADIKVAMISSTIRDLPEHREKVMEACLRLGIKPSMMEHWPSLDTNVIKASLQKVDGADIYIGIFAHRYGFQPKGHGVSITEMEYERAVERGIPRLIFLMDGEHLLKIGQVEIETKAKLEKFKERLKAERVVSFFKSPEELQTHVMQSLTSIGQNIQTEQNAVPFDGNIPIYDPRNYVFYVPYRSKGNQVVGRDLVLKALRVQMLTGRKTAIGQTASFQGLGGLGKTQLAVEYAYLFRDQYPNGVVWLNADQDIDSQLALIAEKAKWVAPEAEHKDKIVIARRRIKSHSHCLIIFDNLESITSINEYFPEPEAEPHLLVTTRTEHPDFVSVPLELLDDNFSLQLLKQDAGRNPNSEDEEKAAVDIATKLGGLPLAIEIAGAYLRHRPIDWTQYRELLDKNLKAALPPKFLRGSFTRHESDLYSTLKINEEIFIEEPILLDILNILTWSGPAAMGRPLLSALLDIQDQSKLSAALSLGVTLRLLQKTPTVERYAIHRLIREVRREDVSLQNREDWALAISERAAIWFQSLKRDFSDLPRFEAEAEHLRAWQENIQTLSPRLASRLVWLQAYPPFHRGNFKDSFDWLQNAKQLFEISNTDDFELKSNLLTDLSTINSSLGKYEEAKICIEEAIEIRLKHFGEQNTETAMSFNNAATIFLNLHESENALKYAQNALKVWTSLHGESHINTALALDIVSSCYGNLADFKESLKFAERALTIRENILGQRHPDTVASYSHIGNIYNSLGEYARSLQSEEKALKIASDLFGISSPLHAMILNNMCLAYLGLNDFKKALEAGLNSLAMRKELFGEQHPETIVSAINVAETHLRMKHVHQAFQLLDYYHSRISKSNPKYQEIKQRKASIVRPGFRQPR